MKSEKPFPILEEASLGDLELRRLPAAADFLLLTPSPLEAGLDGTSTFRNIAFGALESGYTRLIVDLSRLRCVSSRFVESLRQIRAEARNRGGDLVLSSLNADTRAVFEALELDETHEIRESVDGAVDYLQSRPAFPRLHACPGCGKRLRFAAPGRFRCPACGREIGVDASGTDLR